MSGHHGSAPPMYQGQWYGKGNGWDAYAALAAQVQLQQLATGKGWGRNLDVGYKGGKKGKAAWAKGGKPVAGMPMWSGHDRRTQWQCPSCRGRDGNPTLNREYRVCCHKCGESKPNGDKGRGKGVGQGVKASAHRGHSPIGADGQRPMLGKSGMQEGTKVRGRSPLGSLQGINDRRGQSPPDPQSRRYADVARAGKGGQKQQPPPPLETTTPTGTQKGKGGPMAAPGGKGRPNEEDGYTTVDYRAGKKPKVEQVPQDEAERRNDRNGDGAEGRNDDDEGTTRPAEYHMEDVERRGDAWEQDDDGGWGWNGYDYDYACDDDGYTYDQGGYHGRGEEEDDEPAGGEPGWDLEAARQETRECRELYVHLRKTLGRNHAHTKRAYGGLMEAEEREKEIRGPKNYWQEGRKLDKRRAALRKLMERWEAEYDEEEERFQQATYEHEEKQRGLRDRITDAKDELREIQEKFDAHAQLQETGETGGGPKEDAAHRVLKETAHKVAAIIESAGTGKIEQVTEQLNLLSAELGCSLHQLPRKGQEEGHRSGQGKGSSGESRMQRAEAAHRSEAPNAGRWKNKSQDGTSSGEPVGQGAAGPNDAGEDRREAKLAARARGEGSKAAMETDAGQTGEQVEAAGGAAAAEATGQRGVAEEARRQRALDTIRGRIQLEKHRKLAEKQKELVMQGILPEPHQWTEEQLRQNQRQIEISNAEVDAEVEREFSAMSSEAIAKLLEAAAR